jgi:List-Bact-rpt repeat protein
MNIAVILSQVNPLSDVIGPSCRFTGRELKLGKISMGAIRSGVWNSFCLQVLVPVIVVCLSGASLVWAQGQPRVAVYKAIKQAYAPPLSQVAPIPPKSEVPITLSDDDEDEHIAVRPPHVAQRVKDSVLQESAESNLSAGQVALTTNAGVDILGLGTGFTGYTIQAVVPDSNGAVGATQYVQFVNESFAVFNKSNGSLAYGPANGDTLWQSLGAPCTNHPNLDEIAQYDKLAGRWVLMMPILATPGYLCVAVSTTSNAVNGGWNLYVFEQPISPQCNCRMSLDYPKMSVWPDGYYFSYDQGYNGAFEGSAACVVNRNAMLNGNAATMQCFVNGAGTAYGALLPADVDGVTPPPTGTPEYFVNFDYNDASLDLWQFSVNWSTPSASTFTGPTNIPVATFTEPCGETLTEMNYTTGACIPQAGTSQELDSYGDRLMYRAAYRNFGSYASLLANQTVNTGVGTQTGIRWYELRNSGSGFGVYQQGTYAPDSNYRWMGSIAMDHAGDIAVGYSVSGTGMSPSIRYTGRLSTDALGTMEGEVDLLSLANVSNVSEVNTYRWGDYSGMSIDPTDDCTFWYTSEYVPASSSSRWTTRIASFSFPACSQSYTLSVSEVGQGTITSSDGVINCTNGAGTCSAVYASGSAVTLTATPNTGGTFVGWSGACTGSNPCNLVVNSTTTVTATFASNWTLVNKASNWGSPISSLTIPATGSGNVIAVALLFNGSTSVSSVSDNAGNVYVSAGARAVKGPISSEIWYALNSKSGATVITPSFGAPPTHVEITEWEISGLATAAPDAVNAASGFVTLNNTAGPAVTTTQPDDFVISVLFASTASFTTLSSGSAFTDDFTTHGNGWAHLTSDTSSPGAEQASWFTASPSGVYCSSTVAFLNGK